MTRKTIIKTIVALLLITTFAVRGFFVKNPKLVGSTMGTSYSVMISGYVSRIEQNRLRRILDAMLAEVNRQMSTWDADSEITYFNNLPSTESFQCSESFALVVERALDLSRKTSGAFDPTLQPLLNLWGFGSESEEQKIPTDEEIAAVREMTGWDKIRVANGMLSKKWPELSLDLGAIAKGYGVDALTRFLEKSDHKNWFVEIGGEVVVQGLNPDGVPWKIGIQHPTTNPMDNRIQGVVHLTKGAVATSGDYRNYFSENGAVYSHILDPRSGRTVKSPTASVTVIAPNCTDADGIATALFVMGAEEGLRWIEERTDVEAMFLIRGEKGEIIEKFSSGFEAATGYNSHL